jgi:hypothetical protein
MTPNDIRKGLPIPTTHYIVDMADMGKRVTDPIPGVAVINATNDGLALILVNDDSPLGAEVSFSIPPAKRLSLAIALLDSLRLLVQREP